jgi:hypothetical protein
MGRLAEEERFMKPIREWSRSTLIFLGIGLFLAFGLWNGCLGVTSSLNIQRDDAIRIAQEEIDFTPEQVEAKFGRKGFSSQPIWAVLFAVPSATEADAFEHRAVVEVHANSGDVLSVRRDS